MSDNTILTYKNQPGNQGAWRLGEACSRAAADPKCGDYIDRGLILLKELEAQGFGVVVIDGSDPRGYIPRGQTRQEHASN